MLPESQIGECDPRILNQGDVFPDVAFMFAPIETALVELRRNEAGEAGYFRTDESGIALAPIIVRDAIALTYGCEFDRVLKRLKNGKNHASSDVTTVAAVFTMSDYTPQEQHEIRKANSPRYLILEASLLHRERVVDFSTMQPVPLARLLKTSRQRRHGLTVEGRVTLIKALADHLGSDERAKRAGPEDPALLNEALTALGL